MSDHANSVDTSLDKELRYWEFEMDGMAMRINAVADRTNELFTRVFGPGKLVGKETKSDVDDDKSTTTQELWFSEDPGYQAWLNRNGLYCKAACQSKDYLAMCDINVMPTGFAGAYSTDNLADGDTLYKCSGSGTHKLTKRVDPMSEAFEPQKPITPDECGVVKKLKDMNFSRSKPTSKGGFILPMHEGVQLQRQIDIYRRTLDNLLGYDTGEFIHDLDLLEVMPKILDKLKNGKTTQPQYPVEQTNCEEAKVNHAPIMTVKQFRQNWPGYPISIYHDYLREKVHEAESAGGMVYINDADTLDELERALTTGEAPSQPADEPTPITVDSKALRKKILTQLDSWWEAVVNVSPLFHEVVDERVDLLNEQFRLYRKYIKRSLKEQLDPADSDDTVKVDLTQKGTFTLLGKDSNGTWFRAFSLTYSPKGHFEFFEAMEN